MIVSARENGVQTLASGLLFILTKSYIYLTFKLTILWRDKMDWWSRDETSKPRGLTVTWSADSHTLITVLERFDGDRWSPVHRDKLEEVTGSQVKLHDDDYFLAIIGELDTRTVVKTFGHSAFSAVKVIGVDNLPKKRNPRPRPPAYSPHRYDDFRPFSRPPSFRRW